MLFWNLLAGPGGMPEGTSQPALLDPGLAMLASYWIPAEANSPGMYHFICTKNILPGANPTR